MVATGNLFLSRLARALRRERKNFWDHHAYHVRLSSYRGEEEAGVWFRTRGCRFDRAGGCTMCNYSAGPPTTAEEMVAAVRAGLTEVPLGVTHLLVSPSGNFLDPWEVPVLARRAILDLVASYPRISFETRPETVSADVLAEVRPSLGGRGNVYLGLETADPWVAHYAFNKSVSPQDVGRAIGQLRAAGMESTVNVLLGAPFLAPAAMVEDALQAARFALAAGASRLCLLPVHVKASTVLEALWRLGLYTPPSLWAYVELIFRLGREVAKTRVELAWYDSYGSTAVLASPTTCPACHKDVLGQLSAFAETSRFALIEALYDNPCRCHQDWLAKSRWSAPDRVGAAWEAYHRLGAAHLPDWWSVHGPGILASLTQGTEGGASLV